MTRLDHSIVSIFCSFAYYIFPETDWLFECYDIRYDWWNEVGTVIGLVKK